MRAARRWEGRGGMVVLVVVIVVGGSLGEGEGEGERGGNGVLSVSEVDGVLVSWAGRGFRGLISLESCNGK